MPKRALSLLAALLALGAPAIGRAAQQAEAWTPSENSLRADAAGISLPQTIGGLSLSKSGEVSNGGKGVDNYAQYLSDDGAIQATLYIYLPSYADGSLAAYMTDKAIMERFGTRTHRTAYDSVALAGQPGRAIRAVYDDAADGALTTAAAFAHAGRWLVKLRVTGPTERRKDVLAGLDGMLKGLRFDQPQALRPLKPANFSPCPKLATGGAPFGQPDTAEAQTVPVDGQEPLCIVDKVIAADGSYDMLRQSARPNGAVIVPIDDAGTLLTFRPTESGQGYQFSIHSIGQTELFGVYEKVPSAAQIAQILDGKDPQTAQAQATADYAANGEVTTRAASKTAAR